VESAALYSFTARFPAVSPVRSLRSIASDRARLNDRSKKIKRMFENFTPTVDGVNCGATCQPILCNKAISGTFHVDRV
jgi:hypothetical protein